MPLLGFQIGERVLNLTPDDYIDRADGQCSLALMELDVPPPKGPIFVFGDPFLRRFLTVYDKDGPSVGFAVANQGAAGGISSALIGRVRRGEASVEAEETPVRSSEGAAPSEEVLGDAGAVVKKATEDVDGLFLQRDPKRVLLETGHGKAKSGMRRNLVSVSLKRTRRVRP